MSLFKLLDYSLCPIFNYFSLYLGFYVFRNPFLQILKWISRYIQPCYSFFSKWMNFLHFLELFCASFKMSYFQSRKSSWRETTQGQLSFSKHWKWNVLLSFCRIAINKKCHSFKLLDYLSLCPIGFSWTGLASSNDTTKKTLLQTLT